MKFRSLLAALIVSIALTPFALFSVSADNLTESCVESFDATVDYFPEKVEPRFSEGWRVSYHNNYKVVDVLTPFPGAADIDAVEPPCEFQLVRSVCLFCWLLVVHGFPLCSFFLSAQKLSKLSYGCHSYRLFPKHG